MVSGTRQNAGASTILLFTILAGSVCNCFAAPGQWRFDAVKPNRRRPRLLAYVAAQGVCAVQKGNVLAINEGARTVACRDESVPPIGKELPMELTATMTAIMAIVSFGFLAAVILGMI
jgi:hypothetical protein